VDKSEVARHLGVADTEIVEVRYDEQGWHVLHHDMASHNQQWKLVPGWSVPPAPALVGEDGPELVQPPAAEPVGDLDGDGVPDGTAAEVLEWVGDDPDRAAAALKAEGERDKPRTTLVSALEKLAG